MHHDLLLSPFAADGPELVEAARCAEAAGFRAVWTYDHLSASMLDRGLSRDVFTMLGAVAVSTSRVSVGPLVANMMNRHPVQLANAAATLQSLSRGRALLGVGTGAAPESRFSGEHRSIGTALLSPDERRRRLVDTIGAVRALWRGEQSFESDFFTLDGIGDVVGDEPPPPIIVGAGSGSMIDLSIEHGDGVNILGGPGLAALVEQAVDARPVPDFEVSVHLIVDRNHPLGGDVDLLDELGVDRRVLAMMAPFDLGFIDALGARLRER